MPKLKGKWSAGYLIHIQCRIKKEKRRIYSGMICTWGGGLSIEAKARLLAGREWMIKNSDQLTIS